MGRTTIEMGGKFDASHHLPDSNGLTTKKCLNNHGHTYAVKVRISADQLSDNFVVDFGTVKTVIDLLDHAQIIWDKDHTWLDFYQQPEVRDMKHVIIPYVPTAENIAHYLFDALEDAIPLHSAVERVSVMEGVYFGKEDWVSYERSED